MTARPFRQLASGLAPVLAALCLVAMRLVSPSTGPEAEDGRVVFRHYL